MDLGSKIIKRFIEEKNSQLKTEITLKINQTSNLYQIIQGHLRASLGISRNGGSTAFPGTCFSDWSLSAPKWFYYIYQKFPLLQIVTGETEIPECPSIINPSGYSALLLLNLS